MNVALQTYTHIHNSKSLKVSFKSPFTRLKYTQFFEYIYFHNHIYKKKLIEVNFIKNGKNVVVHLMDYTYNVKVIVFIMMSPEISADNLHAFNRSLEERENLVPRKERNVKRASFFRATRTK